VGTGTRTIIDVRFGTDRIGETTYAHDLLDALHAGMIVLADRNFATATGGAERGGRDGSFGSRSRSSRSRRIDERDISRGPGGCARTRPRAVFAA
jgi:hypothetical protein